jgi:hypothetical protein
VVEPHDSESDRQLINDLESNDDLTNLFLQLIRFDSDLRPVSEDEDYNLGEFGE